jgi:L-threonylcarbamoyladenylate synthase
MLVFKVERERPDENALLEAAEAILRGGVIAFPTDTLYGLGCSLFDVSAVEMLARLKRREPGLAVISLISDVQAVYGLCTGVGVVAQRLMERYWPGPLSLIFKAATLVPSEVRRGGTVALRLPRDTLCQALVERVGGPVVASSANLTGRPPAASAEEVIRVFGNQLDLVLDGGPIVEGLASTLVDLSGPRPRLLRRGALDVAADLGDFEDLSAPGAGGTSPPRLDSR